VLVDDDMSRSVSVIERIYDTVSNDDLWVDALDAAADFLGANAMLLVYGNLAAGGLGVVEATGFKSGVLDAWINSDLKNDGLIRDAMSGPVGLMVSSGHRARRREFEETTLYRRLLWPCELRHFAGAAVINVPKVHASLWMSRSEETGEFSQRDFRRFNELVPTVGRAMAVHHRLRLAEMQADLATAAFDRVAVGVVLLDVGGVPIFSNREADRIAARRDGFIVCDGCLAAENPPDSKRLRELIHQVGRYTTLTNSTGCLSGGAVRITRSSGATDYHVVVMPLPRRCQPAEGNGAVTVLFITDPEKTQSPVDFLFGDLYGLTEAEARLVCLLLEGRGLTAAAKQLGLSRNTVHSQLAAVFQKTGTRRQGELLSLLLGGVTLVEGPDPVSGFHEPLPRPPNLTN